MAKWNPANVLARELKRLQQRVSRDILASEPRVQTRYSKKNSFRRGQQIGGNLSKLVLKPELIKIKPWGAVMDWSSLGQKLYWFVFGTETGGRRVRKASETKHSEGKPKRGRKAKGPIALGRNLTRLGGAQKQKPRPINFEPDGRELARLLEEDAFKFFEEREKRLSGR